MGSQDHGREAWSVRTPALTSAEELEAHASSLHAADRAEERWKRMSTAKKKDSRELPAALQAWFGEHNAVCLWEKEVSRPGTPWLKASCWMVGRAGLVIVTQYELGWDIYTPAPSTNKVDESIADAAQRLGLK